jgi:hypothetical protein
MTNFLPQSVEKSVQCLCTDLATPRSLTVWLLFKNGEWDQLASLAVDPKHYLTSESYWRDACVTDLLRKCQDLPTTVDRKAAAEDSFLECERQCFRSNVRLYPLFDGASASPYPTAISSFLEKVVKIAKDILGPCSVPKDGKFGPGATFGDKGSVTTIPDKMSSNPTFTPDSWVFLSQWKDTLWARALVKSGKVAVDVPGNRFTTVPKDAKRDRGIAVEPSINVFYQLAYGRLIRERLHRSGIHLNEGQDKHRHLARVASTEGNYCTLDLSNASDTICTNLVKLILPPAWFNRLNSLRSKKTFFKGKWVFLDKFSSMGNGFTFELETLIFLCLVGAVCGPDSIGKTVFAFGDDLIFPTEFSKEVISVLEFFGMSVNKRKSFVEGPFRESCGGDFFDGVNVRPHFLKESPSEPQQLIALANGLMRTANGDFVREHLIRRAWLAVLDGLPSDIRSLRGPSGLGDLVIYDNDCDRWRTRWRNGIRYFRCYRPANHRKVSWRGFSEDVLLATIVYGVRYDPLGVSPRDSVIGYKTDWVPFS